MPYNPSGGQTYNLNSSISSTATSITLASFTIPVSGEEITMSLLNSDIAFGTISPRTTQSEFISFTGITQNDDGTATLTGVSRGLNKTYPFTSSSTFKLPHSGQSVFILSDAPQVFNKYAALDNDETFTGLITFDQPPVGINPGGQPDASTTVKGIGKVSVAPVSPTSPIFVGDNDPRVAQPTSGYQQGFYLDDANGVTTIAHGLSAAPRVVQGTTVMANSTNFSIYQGNFPSNIASGIELFSGYRAGQIVGAFGAVDSGGGNRIGTVTVDATNIYITWVNNGSPGHIIYSIQWLAQG